MKAIKAARQAFWVVSYYGFLLMFAVGIWLVNVLSLVVVPVAGRERARPVLRACVHGMVNLYARLMIASGALKTNREVLDALAEDNRGTLIVANHPSMLDAPVFLSRIPGLVCVFKSALKQGLLLPVTAKTLGYLSNDEGMGMLREMDQHLKAGDRILVFPEGTRTSERVLNPLNKGYALAAIRAEVPVRLVAVRSDSPVLSKRQHFLRPAAFPVTFTFEIGPVIEPGEFRSVNELNAFVETWLREALSSGEPRPRRFLPANATVEHSGEALHARFAIPGMPFYCHGHMPGNPLVPAYAQMAWIHELVRMWIPGGPPALEYRRLKFLHPIRPGDAVEVEITHEAGEGKVSFTCRDETVTRGGIRLPERSRGHG